MASVTQRIKQIKQPYGGFIPPKMLTMTQLAGGGIDELNGHENIPASNVGMVVDYLTRFMETGDAESSFKISLMGLNSAWFHKEYPRDKDIHLVDDITGLDDKSIIVAAKLTAYDEVYRAGVYIDSDTINPDTATIENIRTMVTRSIRFFEQYGPKKLDGFTFEGGYTLTVCAGDGDFTTSDTLWDFKVSKYDPKIAHTLQILMYWRMGLHSIHEEFRDVQYLGIYNPRLNRVYRISVSDIPDNVIKTVDKDVIGYTSADDYYKDYGEWENRKMKLEKEISDRKQAYEKRRQERKRYLCASPEERHKIIAERRYKELEKIAQKYPVGSIVIHRNLNKRGGLGSGVIDSYSDNLENVYVKFDADDECSVFPTEGTFERYLFQHIK